MGYIHTLMAIIDFDNLFRINSCLKFLIPLTFLIVRNVSADTCTVEIDIPETVSCAAFTSIGEESMVEPKGFFCHMIMRLMCIPIEGEDAEFKEMWYKTVGTRPQPTVSTRSMPIEGEDAEFKEMWYKTVCTRPQPTVSTRSMLANLVRRIMTEFYCGRLDHIGSMRNLKEALKLSQS